MGAYGVDFVNQSASSKTVLVNNIFTHVFFVFVYIFQKRGLFVT